MAGSVYPCVFEGLADWQPAFAVAGIRNAQFHARHGDWNVKTVALRAGEPLRSMGGMALLPTVPSRRSSQTRAGS